ncbi:Protein of unknown function DUF247 [Macleaya cordata]|uniref:Uncharacterized protein n=1 Tax=Macleaya cordata TaxID=56857 RepID=A0A200PWD7_MACCD|nr:Protein of unknown function DUF247 [Macleaya cordata]
MGDASQQNGEAQHVSIEIAEPNKGLDESIKGKLESSIPSHFLVANALLELQKRVLGRKVKSERDDPIFGNIWGFSSLVRDLILLENQIPMLVLNCLFNLPALKEELKDSQSFNMLALRFFNPLMPRDREVLKNHSNCEGKHLLDLLGVKFKKGSTKGSFLDIKFIDGVLINSGDDVGLLRNQGIITNYLGDDEDVSVLFNSLICCEVTLTDFYYAELCDQVNIYYKTRWHKWRVTLKRDYFNNPWAILSVIADVVLLAFTFISTIFASLS